MPDIGNGFGNSAIAVTLKVQKGESALSVETWQAEVKHFLNNDCYVEKRCPRNTYFGLCSEGLVKGIPAGSFLNNPSVETEYAIIAVACLKKDNSYTSKPRMLWKKVLKIGSFDSDKNYDFQMHVVCALWEFGLINADLIDEKCTRVLAERMKQISTRNRVNQKILFCRIGWAEFYNGNPDDKPQGAGSYNENPDNTGFETYNFKSYDGAYYGFVRLSAKKHMHLDRIGNSPNENKIEGVLVVWVSTNPKTSGQYIVGWYKDACVYNRLEYVPEEIKCQRNNAIKYNIFARKAVLIPVEKRTQQVSGMGTQNFWYAEDADHEKEKAISYIKQYCDENDIQF